MGCVSCSGAGPGCRGVETSPCPAIILCGLWMCLCHPGWVGWRSGEVSAHCMVHGMNTQAQPSPATAAETSVPERPEHLGVEEHSARQDFSASGKG